MQTGSVNQHVQADPSRPQPYNSVANGPNKHTESRQQPTHQSPPFSPRNYSSSNTQSAVPQRASVEFIPEKTQRNGLFKGFAQMSKDMDSASVKKILISSVAFFTLFGILAITKLYTDSVRYTSAEITKHQTNIVQEAKTLQRFSTNKFCGLIQLYLAIEAQIRL